MNFRSAERDIITMLHTVKLLNRDTEGINKIQIKLLDIKTPMTEMKDTLNGIKGING